MLAEENPYVLSPDTYDWAGRLHYKNSDVEPEIQKKLYRYIYFSANAFSFKWIKKDGSLSYELLYTPLELIPCPAGRFGGNTDITSNLGIEG